MKALVGTFNQEKALVGAFSVIVQLHRLIDLWLHYFQANNIWQSGYGACYVIFQYNNNIAGIVGERINIMSRPPMPLLYRHTEHINLHNHQHQADQWMRAIKVYLRKFSEINLFVICRLRQASGDQVRSEKSGAPSVTGELVILTCSPAWPGQDEQHYFIYLIAPLMLLYQATGGHLSSHFSFNLWGKALISSFDQSWSSESPVASVCGLSRRRGGGMRI